MAIHATLNIDDDRWAKHPYGVSFDDEECNSQFKTGIQSFRWNWRKIHFRRTISSAKKKVVSLTTHGLSRTGRFRRHASRKEPANDLYCGIPARSCARQGLIAPEQNTTQNFIDFPPISLEYELWLQKPIFVDST